MMGTLVLLDCEFTQFIHVELLSLGMVTLADEARELYVELDLTTDVAKAPRASSSEFVRYNLVDDELFQFKSAGEFGTWRARKLPL